MKNFICKAEEEEALLLAAAKLLLQSQYELAKNASFFLPLSRTRLLLRKFCIGL